MNNKKIQRAFACITIIAFINASHAHSAKTFSPIFIKKPVINHDAAWTIVGAGPAGIITVGLLLDLGIPGSNITWIDPEFNVGRLGKYYESVTGNTKNKLFINFLLACKAFQECTSDSIDTLCNLDLEKEFPLGTIINPLKDITKLLMGKVKVAHGQLTSLEFNNNLWHVGVSTQQNSRLLFTSTHVVLATGSHPRSLDYACDHEISLDIALNKEMLAQQVEPQDSIAVVGSSHSAILLLKFLSELKVKRIINFYKNPIQYSINMGTWLLHNANGLKGTTAEWAREVLEKNPPANLIRLHNTPESLQAWLPICNKIIYAIGFERNELPPINGQNEITYDDRSGIIAPRLFGIGIAFPEKYVDPLGNVEHRVGLNSFMDYAQRIIPTWITKDIRSRLASFEQLFTIDML